MYQAILVFTYKGEKYRKNFQDIQGELEAFLKNSIDRDTLDKRDGTSMAHLEGFLHGLSGQKYDNPHEIMNIEDNPSIEEHNFQEGYGYTENPERIRSSCSGRISVIADEFYRIVLELDMLNEQFEIAIEWFEEYE